MELTSIGRTTKPWIKEKDRIGSSLSPLNWDHCYPNTLSPMLHRLPTSRMNITQMVPTKLFIKKLVIWLISTWFSSTTKGIVGTIPSNNFSSTLQDLTSAEQLSRKLLTEASLSRKLSLESLSCRVMLPILDGSAPKTLESMSLTDLPNTDGMVVSCTGSTLATTQEHLSRRQLAIWSRNVSRVEHASDLRTFNIHYYPLLLFYYLKDCRIFLRWFIFVCDINK